LITFDDFIALSENDQFRDNIFKYYLLQLRVNEQKMNAFKKFIFSGQ